MANPTMEFYQGLPVEAYPYGRPYEVTFMVKIANPKEYWYKAEHDNVYLNEAQASFTKDILDWIARKIPLNPEENRVCAFQSHWYTMQGPPKHGSRGPKQFARLGVRVTIAADMAPYLDDDFDEDNLMHWDYAPAYGPIEAIWKDRPMERTYLLHGISSLAAPEEVQSILTTMGIKTKSISPPAWRPSPTEDPRNADNWEIILEETQSADIPAERPFLMANGAHHVIKLLRKCAIRNPLPTRVWNHTTEAPTRATPAGGPKGSYLAAAKYQEDIHFQKTLAPLPPEHEAGPRAIHWGPRLPDSPAAMEDGELHEHHPKRQHL